MLTSLQSVADKLDIDPLSANAVLLSLSSLTQTPEELSIECATIAGKIAEKILDNANKLKISSEFVGAVFDIIDSLSKVVSFSGVSFLR